MTQQLKDKHLVQADSDLTWLRQMINAADDETRGEFDWSDGDPVYTVLRKVDWDLHTMLGHVDPLLKAKTAMDAVDEAFYTLRVKGGVASWTGIVRLAFNEYVKILEEDAAAIRDKLGDNHHHVINLADDIEKNVTGYVLKGAGDLHTTYQDMISNFNGSGDGLFEAYYGATVVQAYKDLGSYVNQALSNLAKAADNIKDDPAAVKLKTKP
jgi:hypothetical protein